MRWTIILSAVVFGVHAMAENEGVAQAGPHAPQAAERSIPVHGPWPGVGCWFWGEAEFTPEGYKPFIDQYARHTAFQLLTTSIRHPVEVTDPVVHDQINAAARYARANGLLMAMDLDVRLARQAFMDAYPDEMQEIVRLREAPIQHQADTRLAVASLHLGDHYTFKARGYDSLSGRVLRVYTYHKGDAGIDPESLEDVTSRCRVDQADAQGVAVSLPASAAWEGRTACLLAAFTLFTPDVFAPHLIGFERAILGMYADVPLAGACKDEWGFPGRFENRSDDLWYSQSMAKAYGAKRPGRDLAQDLLLMAMGMQGHERERSAAVNHYMALCRDRNAEVEAAFYDGVKEVFGPDAVVATHPTWFPFPSDKEAFKNGLDWWAVKRDVAQTDEATPFCVRTALAKKWGSPLWYNMYYDKSLASYEQDLWRHVLGGGRMNFHPVYPREWEGMAASLLTGHLMRAACRVSLLDYITRSPIDCAVAVVFGHPYAVDWTGKGLGDVGLVVTDALWEKGCYADLVPTSEIEGGALRLGADGRVCYGVQSYDVVVLYQPQFEREHVARFFQDAATGGTKLFRVGAWTRDFEGRDFDGDAALPPSMRSLSVEEVVARVLDETKTTQKDRQTPCTRRGVAGFAESMMPKPEGRCRLIDGTVIRAAGRRNVLGDPIQETLKVNGVDLAVEAVGVVGVRLDGAGRVDALACGALASFEGPGLSLRLNPPLDLALWRTDEGWEGVVQGGADVLPEELTRLTSRWTQVRVPEEFTP